MTAYFDPERETEINVDVSPVCLVAILAQTDPSNGYKYVVAYASGFLSEVELRGTVINRG